MIRPETIESIKAYMETGRPTGGFLYAVLTNDMTEALFRADIENREALYDIVSYIYNNIPGDAWGSPTKVEMWMKKKQEERKLQPMKNYPDPDRDRKYNGKDFGR